MRKLKPREFKAPAQSRIAGESNPGLKKTPNSQPSSSTPPALVVFRAYSRAHFNHTDPLTELATPKPPVTSVWVPQLSHDPEAPTRCGAAPLPAQNTAPAPPHPGRMESATQAQPARAGSGPRPSPHRPEQYRREERPAYRTQGPLAKGYPAAPGPPPAPCPLPGSPALGRTPSTACARLRFRLRLVQTVRPRPPAQ